MRVLACHRLIFILPLIIFSIVAGYILHSFLTENGFVYENYSIPLYFNISELRSQRYIIENDFRRIIYPYIQKSRILPPLILPSCKMDTRLVIGIHSTASNFIERHSIRKSWGNNIYLGIYKNVTQYFFILGNCSGNCYHGYVKAESRLFGDIIYISSLTESYLNLSNKTLSLMFWFHHYCTNAIGLLKTDDDVFVNVPLLWKILDSYSSVLLSGPVIIGKLLRTPAVIRDTGKHKLSKQEYPDDYYPNYVMGGGYLINHEAIERILRIYPAYIKHHKRLFLWEDVTFTGILAQEAKVTLYNSFQMFSQMFDNLCAISVTIVTHNVSPGLQIIIWKKFQNHTNFCSNVIQSLAFIIPSLQY